MIGIAADLMRGGAIALVAVATAAALRGVAGSPVARAGMIAWVAMPALVIAYAWAIVPGALLRHHAAVHGLHALLEGVRLAPIALLVRALAPAPALNGAGIHCLRLARIGAWHRLRAWSLHGSGRAWLAAGCVAFLLGFAEFEIGSRLDAGTWAVRLFDAQAGGQSTVSVMLAGAAGVVTQVGALAAAWWLLRVRGETASASTSTEPARSRVAVGWIAIVVGSVVLVAVPLMTVAWDARAGLAILVRADIRHEVGASVLFAAAAATCAWLAARPLRDLARTGRIGVGITVAACLPGLCGSLAVGLAGLALIQLPALRWLSETPVPLIGALTLLMLPLAIALRIVLDRPDPALHLARMHVNSRDRAAVGSTLLWRLSGSRRYWAWSLLFLMGYADLAASAILHPVDMVPVLVMLYNFMHYGQSSALSARLGAAICAPVVVIVGGWVIVRLGATVTGWLRSARPGAARA